MDEYAFLFYVVCIVIIILVCRIFFVPIKKLIKLVLNSVCGGFFIYLINNIGANFGFHIGLNWWTILCSGFLGIPGVILIILLKLCLKIG